jgi:GT2 family glycosyltransferase
MPQKTPLITIILPLWNRSEYSKAWIENNLFDDFNYIIADGSKSEDNNKIFESVSHKKNVKYIRCPPDIKISHFTKKNAASSI